MKGSTEGPARGPAQDPVPDDDEAGHAPRPGGAASGAGQVDAGHGSASGGGLTSGLRLGILTAAAVLVVLVTELLTRERISEARARLERERLLAVLPPSVTAEDLATGVVRLEPAPPGPVCEPGAPTSIVHVVRDGQILADARFVTAPDGYGGPIDLVVGVRPDGTVVAVRVVAHRETPGLGDFIEPAVSDWIHAFAGRSLADPPAHRWTVGEPASAFDAATGATITSRAVVRAVRRALASAPAPTDAMGAATGGPGLPPHGR